MSVTLTALAGIPEVQEGDDLAALIAAALDTELDGSEVVVVTQKIVSKAEGRVVDLATVEPRPEARAWGERWGKDPRAVELVLRESAEVVRMADGGLIISRTHHGFVCANAGVDLSNTGGVDRATVLPLDPDASARDIRNRLGDLTGARPAVIVSDSFGRPWREGITDVAIGSSGLEPLLDLRGTADADGRPLQATVVAVADQLAAAANLAGGKAEGLPVVVVRGYRFVGSETATGQALVMDRARDLFP
jgi:coenzyme F420-0:L-glutamate ligase/coenzyme F420-1:gamma-L-glutamate ligase